MIQLNTIYNEDCLVTMSKMDNESIDVILTSPPYNIIRPSSTDRGYDLYKDGMSNAEYSDWCVEIFNNFDRILKKDGCILWNMSYGCENTECMSLTVADLIRKTNFTIADIIVWKKSSATPNNVSKNKLTRIVEFVYVFCRRDEFMTFNTNKKVLRKSSNGQDIYENVFNFIQAPNNDCSTELNKATFSTKFVRSLLQMYAMPSSVVYDPFMGTGTTAIGALAENLSFVGSELSDKQTEYARKRIRQETMQLTLF